MSKFYMLTRFGLYFLSALLAISTAKALAEKKEILGADDFECGLYHVSGKIKNLKNGQDALVIYPESNRAFEVDLRDLPAADALVYEGEIVKLKGEIKASDERKEQKYILFQEIREIVVPQQAMDTPSKLLASKDC